MNDIVPYIFSNATAAVIVPLIVFFVVVLLVVRKLIGFTIMAALLLFAIASGFVIANYDILRNTCSNGTYPQNREEFEKAFSSYKNHMMQLYEGLRGEVDANRNTLESIRANTDQILQKLEEHSRLLLRNGVKEPVEEMSVTPT